MLRGDFHHHINTDPSDGHFVHHTAGELIDRAAAVGLNVLAITCHESIPYDEDATRYAAQRGIVLLRGMEATVDGNHTLLLNFPEYPNGICTMADVAAAKTPESLVISPHPFYPFSMAGGDALATHRRLFDAVEYSGLYTPLTRLFNKKAADFARSASLPVVGNTDTHFLWQLGHTFTLIDAPLETAAVVDAIRRNRVQFVTKPLRWTDVVRFSLQSHSTKAIIVDSFAYLLRILRRTRGHSQSPAPSPGLAE